MTREEVNALAKMVLSDTPIAWRSLTDAEQSLVCSRLLALDAALVEIAKGEGEFSRDPLEHASNTVENMKRIAREALAGGTAQGEEG